MSHSILVSILLNLGDVVMATGALSLLREKYPDARIDVMVRPESAEILRHNPDINEVLVYRYKSGKFLFNLGDTIREIRRRRYDTYVSMDRRSRSALITFLARIPNRIGPSIFSSHYLKPVFWTKLLFTRVVPMERSECGNVVEMFQTMLRRSFGIAGSKPVPTLPIVPESAARAESILREAGGGLVIGMSVRANDSLKTWAPERFAELIKRLKRDFDPFIYITGAPSDRQYIEDLLTLCPDCGVVNLAGETSLMDLVALAAKSDLFITLDTGALHLAGHSGLSGIIAIFCSTPPALVRQSVPDCEIIRADVECSPCWKKPEECPDHRCMTGITVDMVYDKAATMLGAAVTRKNG